MNARLRWRLDSNVRWVDSGRAVLGGDPVRLFRLTPSGAELVRSWSAGVVVDASTARSTTRLIDRLADAGLVHPEVVDPAPDSARWAERMAVVVPVRDRPEALRRCLSALFSVSVQPSSPPIPIVVVDDGSTDAAAHEAIVAGFAAEGRNVSIVRRAVSGGPAIARMDGAAAARLLDHRVELVAFVDSDVEVSVFWMDPLLGLFDDPTVGLVAPRVRHVACDDSGGAGRGLDRFESARSPLDLGPVPARVSPNTRVSYVPAASIVVRLCAFDEVNGFDPALSVGEDVDLVWRLVQSGWRCRYEPRSEVVHRGRTSARALLRRRVEYGESAAALDLRHPHRLEPVRGSRWSLAFAAAVWGGHPLVAGAIGASNAIGLSRKLAALSDRRTVAVRLVVAGHLGVVRQLARASVRPWFPLTLAVVWLRRRRAPWLMAAALWAPTSQWLKDRPPLDPVRWAAWWIADDVAYSLGVWRGCWRRRRFGPLGLGGWRDRDRQN